MSSAKWRPSYLGLNVLTEDVHKALVYKVVRRHIKNNIIIFPEFNLW